MADHNAHLVHPRVSIVLYTNEGKGRRHLRHAIDCCLAQTYRNIEVIVVDDHSLGKLNKILENKKDVRLTTICHSKHKGLGASLNHAFAKATGTYFTWIRDIDFLRPSAIEDMVDVLSKEPDTDLVYADYHTLCLDANERTRVLLPNYLQFNKLNKMGPCFLYRDRVKQKLGNYTESYGMMADYDYWIKVANTFRMKRYPYSIAAQAGIQYYGRRIDRMYSSMLRSIIRHSMDLLLKKMSARRLDHSRID